MDDDLCGSTPLALGLLDGFYELHVKAEDGAEYKATVRVLADEETTANAVLQKQPE